MNWLEALSGARRVAVRRMLVRRFGAIGRGTTFDPVTSSISGYEHLYLGDGVFIGHHAIISAHDVPVIIGDDTVIGPAFCLMAGDHRFDVPGQTYRGAVRGINRPVTIGRNVWIGARVTVLKNVTIGDAAIIGAGSVVTRDIPPFAIAVGVPARVVRSRFEVGDRDRHEAFIEGNLAMPSPRHLVGHVS